MKITALLLLTLIPFINYGQKQDVIIAGYVRINSSGKKPAYPAQVKCGDRYGETFTTGRFELSLNKNPGDDVKLEVIKKGYEIVNDEISDNARIPSNSSSQIPIEIYIAPIGETKRIYKKSLEDFIANFPKHKLNDAVRKQAMTLAKQLSMTNFDYVSIKDKKAFELFRKGRLTEVNELLNENELATDLAKADREIAEGEGLIKTGETKTDNGRAAAQQIVNSYLLKAKANAITLNLHTAESIYLKLYKRDSLNGKIIFELAAFYRDFDNLKMAQYYFLKLLDLRENNFNKANVYNELGRLSERMENNQQSLEYFVNAIGFIRKDSMLDEKGVALGLALYNNLANILAIEGQRSTAWTIYKKIIEEIPSDPNLKKQVDEVLFNVYLNMGVFQIEIPNLDSAAYWFFKAKTLLGEKADSVKIASLYINMSDWERRNGKQAEAVKDITVAINAFKNQNPTRISPGVVLLGKAYSTLSALEHDRQNDSVAESSQNKAFNIFQMLFKNDSVTYIDDYLKSAANSCEFYSSLNQFKKAEKYCASSYKTQRKILVKDTTNSEFFLQAALQYANILSKVDKKDSSISVNKEGLDFAGKYQVKDKYFWMASFTGNLGNINLEAGNDGQAMSQFESVMNYLEKCDTSSYKIKNNQAMALNNIGCIYLKNHDYFFASITFQDALSISRQVPDSAKKNEFVSITNMYNNLGQALLYSGYGGAKENLLIANKRFTLLFNSNKKIFGPFYVENFYDIAKDYLQEDSVLEAQKFMTNSLEIALDKEIVMFFRPAYFLEIHKALGDSYLKTATYFKAKKNYLEALKYTRQDDVAKVDLIAIYKNLCIIFQHEKDSVSYSLYKKKLDDISRP